MDVQHLKAKFKENFPLPAAGFSQLTDFVDVAIGFAVFKDRAEPGYKSLFKIIIPQEELMSASSLKKIRTTVSYGKDSPDGLIIASTELKKGINSPIDLESDDFSYDIKKNELYYKASRITGLDLLSRLDQLHTKPTKPIRGLWLRIKLISFHVILATLFKWLFGVVAWLQYLISGDRIHIFDNLYDPRNQYNPQFTHSVSSDKAEPIEVFGYRVNPWIAIVYSLFHLVVYFLCYYYNFRPKWLTTIFENNFLTIIYVVLTLGFTNAVLPEIMSTNKALRLPLTFLQTRYLRALGKKVRI